MEHTILVVEDEQGIREAIGIYMKNQGYNVILAANGKEGLEKIETSDIHLAIVDIMMPVMNGNEAAQKIRWSGWADARKIPIIAVTACASEENRTASADAGINGYLTKPLDVEKLVSTLVALIRNTTAREECARL